MKSRTQKQKEASARAWEILRLKSTVSHLNISLLNHDESKQIRQIYENVMIRNGISFVGDAESKMQEEIDFDKYKTLDVKC